MDGSSKSRKPKLALRRWREASSTAAEPTAQESYHPQGRVIVPFAAIEREPGEEARIVVLVPATD